MASVHRRGRLERALVVACLAVVALGVVVRFVHIGRPTHMTWDEHHFVENARNYIEGRADWNDHPALGKLIIAVGILVRGDNAAGWRAAPFVAGCLAMALAYLLGARLFRDPLAGLLAGAFMAMDGFFITFSRVALLDQIQLVFVLAAALAMARLEGPREAALAAVAAGLAASVKWTGAFALVPLPLVLARRGRLRDVLWCGPLVAAVYAGVFYLGLALARQPIHLAALWQTSLGLFEHHVGLSAWKHPQTSHWYTWPFLVHPIFIRHDHTPDRLVKAMSTVGNPLLWWASTLALVGAAAAWVRARRPRDATAIEASRPSELLLLGWAGGMVTWVVSHRDSYIYHYLAAYAYALVLLAGFVARVARRRPAWALAGFGAAVVVSAFFAPIWLEWPLPKAAFDRRLWLPGWRP